MMMTCTMASQVVGCREGSNEERRESDSSSVGKVAHGPALTCGSLIPSTSKKPQGSTVPHRTMVHSVWHQKGIALTFSPQVTGT